MTSSCGFRPLSLLAILLVADFTNSAPTNGHLKPGAHGRSPSRPSWHLLLALWRPKGEGVTAGGTHPPGEVLLTPTQPLPAKEAQPTRTVPPTRGVLPTRVVLPARDVIRERIVLPTREDLPDGRVLPVMEPLLPRGVAPPRTGDPSEGSEPPAVLHVVSTPYAHTPEPPPHPQTPIRGEPFPHFETEALPSHSVSGAAGIPEGFPAQDKQEEDFPIASPVTERAETVTTTTRKLYLPFTVRTSVREEHGDGLMEGFGTSRGDLTSNVVVSTTISNHQSVPITLQSSSRTVVRTSQNIPSLTTAYTTATSPLTMHTTTTDQVITMGSPVYMHGTPGVEASLGTPMSVSPTRTRKTNMLNHRAGLFSASHPTSQGVDGSRGEEAKGPHSNKGSKVLELEGPVVMETLDGSSLVPLVGRSKEVLTLKGDGKAILAILQVAQGSNTLEDPFHVTSVIRKHDQPLPTDGNTSETSPSGLLDQQATLQDPLRNKNLESEYLDHPKPLIIPDSPQISGLTNLLDKESKSDDSQKSLNALDVHEKAHLLLTVPKKAAPSPEAPTTTAKPIYEEISDTLQVDSSIDDVEDFDILIKHTENTDEFLSQTNQSHTNLIDAELHNGHEIPPSTDPTAATSLSPGQASSTPPTPEHPPTTATAQPPTLDDPETTTSRLLTTSPPEEDEEEELERESHTEDWSVFVANVSSLSNKSLALNESVFQARPEMSIEDHHKIVLKERGSLMLQLMDPSADPCSDFYQFACGKWNGKFPIRQDKAVDNTFERLKEDLDDVLRSLLEEPTSESDNNITKAVKTLYSGCMNIERIETLGAAPLLELLDELGGWPVLLGDAWNGTDYDWVRQMAQLRNYNNDILISEWVAADITNSSNHIIQLDQPMLGLPGREYFINPGDFQYREAYLNLMLSVTQILGASVDVALRDMTEVLHFEKQLSRILTAAEERRNMSAIHRKMTLEELNNEVPGIDWQDYIDAIGWNNNHTEEIVVFGLDYFRKLVPLLNDTDSRTISNYLLWRFVKNRISNLGDKFTRVKQDYIKVLFGRKSQPERWRSCVEYVTGNLGYVVGAMFVRRYFPEASKHDTDEMISLIRFSFKTAVKEALWMDPDTRSVAMEKVDTIVKNVGYPEYLMNDTYMDQVYSELSFSPDEHFKNVLKMLQFHARTNHNLLAAPVNRTAWVTTPAVVNAYYSRSKNMIVFPAGILQPPFYHPAFPKSLNYGGIGVVIGHEITHGFDDRGRQFDKNGNLNQWWKPEDVSKFYQRASCMLDQYGEYKVDEVGLNINPVNTLGENIADNAGIKIAYQAYKKWAEKNEEQVTVPYVNLTHDQLFFLNFGQIWCENNRPEAMLTKIRSGQHSPNKFRVIGTLSNSEDFSRAYNCPVGSRMNPERKCKVW